MNDQDTYFVITGTVNGETFVEPLRKDDLLARLHEQYAHALSGNDTAYWAYWNGGGVIIKGTLETNK